MYEFDIPIYADALSLLLKDDRYDISEAIKYQLAQGDPALEDVGTYLPTDTLVEVFNALDLDELMQYISFNQNAIAVDYDETYAVGDPGVVAFNVPCTLDLDKFISDYV
jgi:hypothetical protein